MQVYKLTFFSLLVIITRLYSASVAFVPVGQASDFVYYNLEVSTTGGNAGVGGVNFSGSGFNASTSYFVGINFEGGGAAAVYTGLPSGTASTGSFNGNGFFTTSTTGEIAVHFTHANLSGMGQWPSSGTGTMHWRVTTTAGGSPTPATGYQLTIDLARPSVLTASITSSNATNSTYATTGNTVTVGFTTDENLGNTEFPITGSICGVDITASQGADAQTWTVSNIVSTHADGTATFDIVVYDAVGNQAASNLTTPSDGSTVTIDKTDPVVTASISSNNATTSLAKKDDVVTLNVSADEVLNTNPTVTIDGNAETTNPQTPSNAYSAERTMETADTQGQIAFAISNIIDRAGNTASTVSATNDGTSVTFDSNAPTLTGLTMASDNNFDNDNLTSLAKSGDLVTLTFYTNETAQTPTALIAGETATVTGSASSWVATKTMDDTDSDGSIALVIDFKDLAGNSGTQATSVLSGSAVTYDNTDPTILTTVITSSNATNTLATTGDVITVSLTSNEDLYNLTDVTIATQTVQASDISETNATTWSFEYTMLGTETDGAVAFTFTANDLTGNGTTVTAATSGSVMFDKTLPTLSTVEIASNNANTSYAKSGNVVTLTISSDEDLIGAPTVLLAGRAATVATTNAQNYTATMTMNNTDTQGAMSISINFTDLYGNAGTAVTATTNSSSVTYDRSVPTLSPVTYTSNNANTSYAKTGDIITLSFTGSEGLMSTATGGTDPVATIATAAAVESGTGASWTATYTMQAGDAETAIPFTIDFNDIAGNAGTRVTGLTSGSSITYDETVPTLTTVSIASNNSEGATLATVGNVITLSIVSDENIQTPTITIAGNAAAIATGSNGETSYTATYTMASTDAAAAPIAFTVDFKDMANNDGTQVVALVNDLDGGVTFDKQAPSFTTVSIASNNATNTLAKVGNVVTITLASDEAIKTGADPTVKIGTVSSVGNTATVTRVSPTSFTAAYTMTSSDDQGVVAISIENFTDATGNAGTTQTTTLDGSSVTFDRTVPTIPTRTILSNNANTAYAKENDIVTLTIVSAEDLLTPTVLLGGDAATVTAGADGSNWTAAKTMDDADTQGAISISIAFSDLAGNAGVTLTSSSDGNNVTYDRTAPSITTATIASNNTTDDILAVPGNVVTLTFVSNEDIQTPAVTIATQTATVSAGADAKNWTAAYTMTENESNGTVPFSITYMDLASNAGAAAQTGLLNDTDGAVTFDKTQPSLSAVTLTSDNSINNAYGREGSILTLAFSASEQLNSTQMAVTIATETVTPSITTAWNGTAEIWAASYTLSSSDYDGQSGVAIPFTIDYEDLNGYDGTQVTEADAAAAMTFDRNAPTITSYTAASSSGTNYAKAGDIITLTLTTNENLDEPVITIAGNTTAGGLVNISQGGNAQTWTATYTMRDPQDDDITAIASTLSFTDLAGNAGTSQAPIPSIIFDKTVPTTTAVTISSNNTNSTAAIAAGTLAKPGDLITLLFTFSETIASPVVTITGQTPTITNASGDELNWQATYLTTAATADGTVAFTIDFTDAAGNAGVQIATAVTSGSNVTFDGTAATINPVAISSDNTFTHFAKEGDLMTLTFTANEDIDTRQLPTVSIAGALPSSGAGNAAAVTRTSASGGSWVYSATYTMGGGTTTDEEGTVQFVLAYEDIAGNAGTNVVAITTGPNVTYDKTVPFTGDATYPYTINCTQAGTLTPKRATTNEPVTLAMVFNDEIIPPTITIAGNAPTSLVQGSDRTIWTAAYTMSNGDTEDGNRMPITIAMTDSAGNTGNAISATVGTDGSFVIFDKTAPSITSLSISSNNTWDDWSASSTHPLDPDLYAILGSTITITVIADEPLWSSMDSVLTNNAPVTKTPVDAVTSSNSDKTWASTYIMQTGNLAGEINFAITLTDSAGKTLTGLSKTDITDGSSITYDETAPNASAVRVALSSGSDTGEKSNDNLTNLARPQFDITGLTTGDSVLVAADDVILYREVVGNGISSFSGIQLTSDLTHSEVTGHEIKVYLRDPAGNLSTASPDTIVRVDTELFTITSTPDLLALDDSGFLNDDDLTNVSQPRFRLTNLPPNDRDGMKVYYWSLATSEAVPSGDGTVTTGTGSDTNYRMSTAGTADTVQLDENLSAGWYAIKYTITDSAGNESAKSDQTLIFLDQTPADAPTGLDLDATTDTGILNTDNLTNLTTLTFNISDVRDTDSILVYNASGDVLLGGGLVPVGGSTAINPQDYAAGTFQFVVDENLSTGTNTLSLYAKSKDVFGNLSDPTPANLSITVDTEASDVAAAAATIDLLAADDTGISSTDNETNVLIPRFSITGPTLNDSIYIYADLVKKGAVEATADPMEIGVGNNMGATTLAAGDYTASITITLVDDAGNESSQSNAITVKIDTEAPNPGSTAPNLVAEDDTGWDNTDNNTSNLTNASFDISGLTTVLDSIVLYAEGVDPVLAPMIVAKDGMDVPYNHTIEIQDAIPADGSYRIYYTLVDIAGNASINSDHLSVVFDLTPPLAPDLPDLLSTTDLGEFSDDNITDTNNVQIKINYQEPNTRGYLKRYNVLTPDDTTTILGIYSISADLIVGADGTKTYNQDDVIADGDSAKFIYFPVTVDSAGNEADEGPDLTVVYDYKDPTGIVTYSDADDTVWAGNASTVATITFNEALSVLPAPTITLTYPEGGGTVGPVNLINDDDNVNKKWRYTIDLDEPQYQTIDGYMNITITADDIAGNPVSSANMTDEDNLLFDNTKSEFRNITPETNAYINALNGFSWFLTEPLQSGIVHFDNQTLPSAADIQVALTGAELTAYGFLTDPSALLSGNPQLVDGHLYNITYQGIDIAGNTGMDTVYSVRYDTTMPTANLNFSRLFASENTTVICTVMFNEPMLASPRISLDYGGVANTNSDVDSVAMVSTGNDSIWIYTATMPGGIENQGIVKPTVYAKDLATNNLDTLIVAATDSLYLDNTVATATLSYTNITQDTILVYHPNSPPDTLRNVGIGGDTISITVTMNEPILTSPAPTLTLKYNSGSGATRTITGAVASNGDSIWVFTDIVLLDSTQNDGVLKVELNAQDRSTNPVVNFANQTDLLFKADNIHPAPFNMSEIRLSSVNPSLIVDWQDLGNNWVDMDNDPEQHWYNERVSHFYMNVPLPPYDVPGLTDTTMWGGMVDIQFKNLRGPINGQEWVTIGASDTLDPEVNFDSTLFFRDTAAVNSAIVPYNGFILGDSLLVRSVQTDIHGNKTISNFDTTDIHKFFYDRTQMNVGELVGGNIFTQDTLFSTDSISIQWTDFLDPGGSGASGFWKYTFTIAHHTVSASDTSMKGYYNGTMWENWAEEDTAITSAAFIFNSADVDTLKHNERYEFMIFGQDLAGNMSDTLSSGIKVKYNSDPVISAIDSWTMYEDSVYGDFQHILTSDADSSTFQGDIVTYSVKTFRDDVLYTAHPIDIDFNVLSWSPKQADVGNYTVRVIAEDLSQLKDSLEFVLEVIAVNDAPVLAFVDSMGFLINPDSMLVVSFDEDAQTNFTLNLTQYVEDVDNNDSTEITWQAVILDTNQLGDPFPLGQVIVGPGTSIKQKVSLMREFMGINPKSGLNFNLPKAPSVARQTRTSISQITSGNHPITISLDTLENFEGIEAVFESDSNYYGNEHRVIFIVQDPFVPGDPNSQLESRDTLMVSVIEENDAPVMQEIEDWNIAENDSLVLDFTSYTTDVDDSVLTFVIKALTNPEYMTIIPDSFLSDGTGDPVILKPQALWSEKAQIQVVAMDEAASDTSTFLLDIIRVVRPAPAVSIIQNNVFSHYLDIVIVDTVQKTTDISFEIQSEPMILDTIAPYTWTSNFNFGVEKSYSFEIQAEAVVGDTLWGNAFVLALAQSAGRWFGTSSDGSFSITGESGSVPADQPLLIVDSTLFSRHFTDQASYIVGNENYQFQAPVRVSLASRDAEQALYNRKNGAWVELPSISTEGTIITYSDQAGYYRLGPKTIIVPEMTNLHPNYPNPFNPVTNIRYDIGLLDGLRQNVSIHVYNLLGQRIRTLVKNMDQLGQFTIQWNGRNEAGKDMPTGIYFIQLTTGTGIVKNLKMMLLK